MMHLLMKSLRVFDRLRDPAQPDHTEKGTLFKLLDAESAIGLSLTESFAMWPGGFCIGLYFSHPDSAYFELVK